MNDPIESDRALLAFLSLMARFRDYDGEIYDEIAPGYDRFADHWDRTFARPAVELLFRRIAERAPPRSKVLDAGCGTGRQVDAIHRHLGPRDLVGVDKSRRMLDFGRRKFASNRVAFVDGDLLALPFPDDYFDAVVSVWVLETLADPRAAVRELLRVVKTDGVVGYTFVQMPTLPKIDQSSSMSELIGRSTHLAANFSADRLPFHECDRSTLECFHDGLISVVTLGKCCEVEDQLLPTGSGLGSFNDAPFQRIHPKNL